MGGDPYTIYEDTILPLDNPCEIRLRIHVVPLRRDAGICYFGKHVAETVVFRLGTWNAVVLRNAENNYAAVDEIEEDHHDGTA